MKAELSEAIERFEKIEQMELGEFNIPLNPAILLQIIALKELLELLLTGVKVFTGNEGDKVIDGFILAIEKIEKTLEELGIKF